MANKKKAEYQNKYRKDTYQSYMIFFNKFDNLDRGIINILSAKTAEGRVFGRKSGSMNGFIKECIIEKLQRDGNIDLAFLNVSDIEYEKEYAEVEAVNGNDHDYKQSMNVWETYDHLAMTGLSKKIKDGSIAFCFTDEEKKHTLVVEKAEEVKVYDYVIIEEDSKRIACYVYVNAEKKNDNSITFNAFYWRPAQTTFYATPYSQTKEGKEVFNLFLDKQIIDRESMRKQLTEYADSLDDDVTGEDLINALAEKRNQLKKGKKRN